MNQMNQVILEGNVVRMAEFKTTPRGKKVCTLPIACNRYYKDSDGKSVEEANYIDIEAWERACENVEKYAMKGRGLRVVGRLKQDRWKSPEGKSISRLYVVAEHIEFMPLKRKENSDEYEKENAKIAMQSVAEEQANGDLAF